MGMRRERTSPARRPVIHRTRLVEHRPHHALVKVSPPLRQLNSLPAHPATKCTLQPSAKAGHAPCVGSTGQTSEFGTCHSTHMQRPLCALCVIVLSI